MTADPWALLREARDRLSLHMETYFSQQKGSMFLTIDLVDRIDAALAERQDSAKDVVESDFIFRGGFVEGQDGSRWWSENLLKRVENERDEARAKAERVQLQLEGAMDSSKEGAWMARALDVEQELADVKAAAIAAARGL